MPRTMTITKDIYQFDELDDRAKERARDWFRECQDSNDFDSVIDDFVTIANIIGIEFSHHNVQTMGGKTRLKPNIYWSGFCGQGDGACFEGEYHFAPDSCAKIREHCEDAELLRVTDELTRIQAGRILLGQAALIAQIRKTDSHYCHEHTTEVVVWPDEDDSDYVDEPQITDLMRDLMRWLYKQLDTENDYLNSDEYIDDAITCNAYEFDVDGRPA